MNLSSFRQTNDKLVQILPGSYFRVSKNQRVMIKEATTGLLVSSLSNDRTGENVYNVALVDGDLILIPSGDPCLANLEE